VVAATTSRRHSRCRRSVSIRDTTAEPSASSRAYCTRCVDRSRCLIPRSASTRRRIRFSAIQRRDARHPRIRSRRSERQCPGSKSRFAAASHDPWLTGRSAAFHSFRLGALIVQERAEASLVAFRARAVHSPQVPFVGRGRLPSGHQRTFLSCPVRKLRFAHSMS
jgi:hypothetical protein